MRSHLHIFIFITSVSIFGCSSEDEEETALNNPPGTFTASVADIAETSATLSWNAPVDEDGDDLSYDVSLGNQTIGTDLAATSFEVTDLTASTSYSGTIIASDGNGGTSTATFDFKTSEAAPVFTIDPSLMTSANFIVDARLVDCTLENGSTTKCYEFTFISNPLPDDGPFCPSNTSDIGGMGIYDGATNPGFQVMKASLFQSMESDGYDIIDRSGNIRTSDFSGMDNPNFDYCLQPAVDDNLQLTFTIPAIPEALSTPNTIESVEFIGVSVDGVPMNGDPPSVTTGQMGNGNIPSLDPCGGHHDPSGYYHMHFVQESVNEVLAAFEITEISCTNRTQSASALAGFAKDGYPIYAYADASGVPSDLDACNGHTAATDEYPQGVYHYHASRTSAPNMPPCLIGAAVSNPFVVN